LLWQANPDMPPPQEAVELAQENPAGQLESSTHVEGMQEPTGVPQKHTLPGSQSASFMHP
jgi:hypothetical protein